MSSERIITWVLPALMLLLVMLSGYAVSQGWGNENSWRFTVVALVAGLTSGLLAKSRLLDGFAIFFSFVFGITTVWIATALLSGQLEGGVLERLRAYPRPVIDALYFDQITGANRDLTADTLLSLTVWLSSWIAMWLIIRVGYVLLALLAPVALIVANQHFSGEDSLGITIAMVVLSVCLIVGQRFAINRISWQARHVPVADSLMKRAFITGLAISVVVSSVVMISPQAWSQTVLQPMIDQAVERLEEVRLEASHWFDDLLGTETAGQSAGSYTDFSDGFQVGGPLSLTDEPEVLVRADAMSAPYLKARSYNSYTGRGWVSGSIDESGDDSQTAPATQELRYNPNWQVALSPDARYERESVTISVSPLSSDTRTVFAVDSFVSADMQTVVRMSWTTVTDLPLPMSINTLNQMPPDVQRVGSLLLQSELTGSNTAWGPGASSPTMQEAIDTELDELARRGIEVRWTASADGIVDTLYITGRLPVFDDVEAVFRYQQSSIVNPAYQTTSYTSIATPDQLAAAGSDYPQWVTDRYLQTGETVTDRTIQLAQEIVGDETNPYVQATLIEDWLRRNITYDLSVDAPPRGQDLVDYVLFDHTYGYCEHYAASMTVMLRSLGVPSRIVVGYAPGQWDDESSGFVYRQNNAHAWVEAYFPGYSWIPFEPTANQPLGEFDIETTGVGIDLSDTEDTVVPPTEAPIPTADIATPDVSQDNTLATPQPTSEDASQQPPVPVEPGQSGGIPRGMKIAGVVGLGVAGILGGVWMMWNWSLRGLSPAAALMRRLQRVGSWIGVRSGPTTTPREYARAFDSSPSGISAPVKRITRAYEIETFGPRQAREHVLADASRAWSEIKRKWYRLLRRK